MFHAEIITSSDGFAHSDRHVALKKVLPQVPDMRHHCTPHPMQQCETHNVGR